MMRTSKTKITFNSPFVLTDSDHTFPAGVYDLETDEELLPGLSFQAYRRVASRIHIPADPDHKGTSHTFVLNPSELDLALERDKTVQPVLDQVDQKTSDQAEDDGLAAKQS